MQSLLLKADEEADELIFQTFSDFAFEAADLGSDAAARPKNHNFAKRTPVALRKPDQKQAMKTKYFTGTICELDSTTQGGRILLPSCGKKLMFTMDEIRNPADIALNCRVQFKIKESGNKFVAADIHAIPPPINTGQEISSEPEPESMTRSSIRLTKISPKEHSFERRPVPTFRKAKQKLSLLRQIRSQPQYKPKTRLVAAVRSALIRAVLKWRTYNKGSLTGYPTNLNELKQLVENDPEAANDGILTVKMIELFEFRAFIDATSVLSERFTTAAAPPQLSCTLTPRLCNS